MARATSNYRQVRITITEEAGGRVSCRVMVKPVNEGWAFRHTVWHHNWRQAALSVHWLDLAASALRVIAGEDLSAQD